MDKKLDCFGNYYGTYEGRLQIIYLSQKLQMANDEIARITGYAISTIKNYVRKYCNLLEEAIDLFFYGIKKQLALVEDSDDSVAWCVDCPADGVPCAYVSEVYKGTNRLFIKIGYSAHMRDRMKAHATSKRYGSDHVVVRDVYSFDSEEQALSMENLLRKYYKEKNDCSDFLRNDRFTLQEIKEKDLEIFKAKANFIKENF